MLAIAHDARVLDRGAGDGEEGRTVRVPHGLEASEVADRGHAEGVAELDVDLQGALRGAGGRDLRGEGLAERLDAVRPQGHPRRGAVTTEALEEAGAAAERRVQIDVARGPAAAVTALAVERDHHRGHAEAIAEARGGDADDTTVEALGGDHDPVLRLPAPAILDLGDGLVGHRALHGLALVVDLFDLGGEPARLVTVATAEEREGQRGVGEPTGGVQARGEPEGDLAGAELLASAEAGAVAEGLHAGAELRRGQHPQPRAHERAVVAVERRHVGDGAEGDQIQLGAESRAEAGDEAERQARAAEPGVVERAVRPMRVQEGVGRQRLVGDQVVIDHDDVHAPLASAGDARMIGRAAVTGDQQVGVAAEAAVESRVGEAVAALEAVRGVGLHLGAELLERVGEDRRAGGAVDVVVAEERDPLALATRGGQSVGGGGAVGHHRGIAQVRQPRLEEGTGGRAGEPPLQEDLRGRRADPHLGGQRRRGDGIGGAHSVR